MRSNKNGFTLIEVILVVLAISICLMSVMRLLTSSNKSLTQSIVTLNAQASADDMLQQIKLMKWDNSSVPGQKADLSVASVTNQATPKTAIEHWNGYTDVDTTRAPYGPFRRTVTVDFVSLDGNDVIVPSVTATDRKRVRVETEGQQGTFNKASITAIFYNRP